MNIVSKFCYNIVNEAFNAKHADAPDPHNMELKGHRKHSAMVGGGWGAAVRGTLQAGQNLARKHKFKKDIKNFWELAGGRLNDSTIKDIKNVTKQLNISIALGVAFASVGALSMIVGIKKLVGKWNACPQWFGKKKFQCRLEYATEMERKLKELKGKCNEFKTPKAKDNCNSIMDRKITEWEKHVETYKNKLDSSY